MNNSTYEIKKILSFRNLNISFLEWVNNTNFLYFIADGHLIIFNFKSTKFNQIINIIQNDLIDDKQFIKIKLDNSKIHSILTQNFKILKKNISISIEFIITSDNSVCILEVTIFLNIKALCSDTEFTYTSTIKYNEDHCKVISNNLDKFVNVITYQNKIMTVQYEKKLFSILDEFDSRIFNLIIDTDPLFIKKYETENNAFICILNVNFVNSLIKFRFISLTYIVLSLFELKTLWIS